jgi:hypothetical protein
MADDQRTRIADIVYAQKPILNYRHCEMVADAVIAELGLHWEDGWHWPRQHRYVTPWANDE